MSVSEAKKQATTQGFWQIRRMVLMAMFIALSVVGAMLKIPSPTGTVALDSAPGFLGAALLGWREGLLIAALGHLISAYSMGFPLSIPIHLIIALQMAIAAALYYILIKKTNPYVSIAVVTLYNGLAMPLSLVPMLGIGMFYAMALPLCVAAFINALIAYVCFRGLKSIV
ncbi:MAG: ECF transporter S component [Clostridia bacterium]|nr:ECF transporter S component [Clostridia bacterium]